MTTELSQRLLLILLLVALPLAKPAQAGTFRQGIEAATQCVRDQIAILDAPQPRTSGISAKARFRLLEDAGRLQEHGSDLAVLNSAAILCYRFGVGHAKLRKVWPSREQTHRLVITPGLQMHAARITELTDEALSFAREAFDLEAPLPVLIYVANSLRHLRQAHLAQGYDIEDFHVAERTWELICDKGHGIAGFANAYRIVVCLTGEGRAYDFDRSWVPRAFANVMAHEYTHSFQMQVTGDLRNATSDAIPSYGVPGPAWMLEGFAEFVGSRIDNWAWRLRRKLRERMKEHRYTEDGICRRRRRQVHSYERIIGPSSVAVLTVARLDRDFGSDTFARFYADIGLTLNWRQSFRNIFGGTPDEVLGCGDP